MRCEEVKKFDVEPAYDGLGLAVEMNLFDTPERGELFAEFNKKLNKTIKTANVCCLPVQKVLMTRRCISSSNRTYDPSFPMYC